VHVLSDPITDCFSSQPPCANAKCVGVGCQNKDVKSWCKSKLQKDPVTDKGLPMCGPCSGAEVRIHPPSIHSTIFSASDPPHLSQPERVGDECAMCGKCDPNCWLRSKILVRADGTPAPLCKNPCYTKECAQIKKEQKEA